jgi:hypothetical protein
MGLVIQAFASVPQEEVRKGSVREWGRNSQPVCHKRRPLGRRWREEFLGLGGGVEGGIPTIQLASQPVLCWNLISLVIQLCCMRKWRGE